MNTATRPRITHKVASIARNLRIGLLAWRQTLRRSPGRLYRRICFRRDIARPMAPVAGFHAERVSTGFHLIDPRGIPVARLNAQALLVAGRVDGIHSAAGLARAFEESREQYGIGAREALAVLSQLAGYGAVAPIDDARVRGCVVAHHMGRLGNHLTIHAVGRGLADRLGFDFFAAEIPGFPGTAGFDSLGKDDRFWDEVLERHRIDDATWTCKRPRNVLMRGYFQRYEYFRDYREHIRDDWLRIDKIPLDDDHLVVHVRSGDVWARYTRKDRGHQGALPVSYYRNIIDRISWNRMTVVTSHVEDPIVGRLSELYDCDVRSGSVIDDFRFLASAKRLVMSASTFAWWAAWLSDAREVHFPLAEMWRPSDSNARAFWVDDEDRYVLHQPVLPKAWRGDAEDERVMVDC